MMTIQHNHSLSRSASACLYSVATVPLANHRCQSPIKRQNYPSQQGHSGEIMLIIENHLPIETAYRMDARSRAVTLLAHIKCGTPSRATAYRCMSICAKRNCTSSLTGASIKKPKPTHGKRLPNRPNRL